MQPERGKEANLAGLGFSFSPVKLAVPPRGCSRGRPSSADGRLSQPEQGQQQRQPQARAGSSKAVSFNLKTRRPGPAYNSPQLLGPQDDVATSARPRSAESPPDFATQNLRHSWPQLPGGAGSVDSAVELLHALKQRPATAEPPTAAARPAGLARLKEAALARRKGNPAEVPNHLQQANRAVEPEDSDGEEPAVQQQGLTAGDASLLHRTEMLLAGCGAGTVAKHGHAPSPRHMQLVSIPDRAWVEEEENGGWGALPPPSPPTSPQRRILRPGDVLPKPVTAHRRVGRAEQGLTAAQPATKELVGLPCGDSEQSEAPSIQRVHAILSSIRFPSSPTAPHAQIAASVPAEQRCEEVVVSQAAAPAADELGALAVQPAEQGDALPAPPTTLQEALQLLGLLSAEEGSGGSDLSLMQGPAVHVVPLQLKLRAAAVVLAAKQEAGRQALRPLLARLRHIRANLEFHKANASRSRTPPRQRPPSAEQPWLSGSSGAASSKHKRARSRSPGRQLAPRPRVGPTSQEASELQVKLLISLLPKLWLKLGIAALRNNVALTRLRQRLLSHIHLTEAGKVCIRAARAWKEAAVPSEAMVAAGGRLRRQFQRRQKLRLLQAWQAWAKHRRWQQERVQQGLSVYHRQLKEAAVSHWRVYCQERHVARLQQALAARWLSAWTKRKVLTMWRQVARRGALQKQALLGRISGTKPGGSPRKAGSSPSKSAGAPAPSKVPSILEALRATRGAFQSVKDYVSSSGQDLHLMRECLRFSSRPLQLQWEEHQEPNSPQPSSPTPVGSLQALLALLQPQALPVPGSQQESCGQAQPWQQLRLPAAPLPAPKGGRPGPLLDPLASEQPRSPESPPVPAHWPAIDTESPGIFQPALGSSPLPSPSYDPARYASPTKLPSSQHGPQSSRGPGMRPEAIQAEMEGHIAAVAHIRQELEGIEQEAVVLQQEEAELEQRMATAQQEAALCRQESLEAERAKQSTAQALQAAIEQHTAASTRCASLERQVQQQELTYRQAVGNEAEAKAGYQAAAEQQAVASIAAGTWTKKVDSIARELSQCHRTQQPVVAARLREARQQQHRHQAEVASLQSSMVQLKQASKEAASRAERALQELHATRAEMVAAVNARTQLQQQIKALMEAHERHAVEAVAKEQAAAAADQAQRQAAHQRQLGVQRLQSIAAQVLVRQQDAQQLTERVAELQQLQRQAAATALAGATFKLGGQRRAARGEAAAGAAAPDPPTASPPASPPGQLPLQPSAGMPQPSLRHRAHRARPVLSSPSSSDSSACETSPRKAAALATPADRGLLLAAPAAAAAGVGYSASDGSELSSLCSSPCLPSPPAPRTVGEASDAFYRACLLRHALRALRQEAARAREQECLAQQHFEPRMLGRCLEGWRLATAATQEWLGEVQPALRRRGCLQQWMAWVKERQRLRHCEEQLHEAYCRRRLLWGLVALRAHAEHQRWRDAVHEAVVRLRWRNMLRGWRDWARSQRVDAVALARARAVYYRRLLTEAWQQWAWVARNKALLRRVFQTAADLWKEEVGALLHTRNYEVMGWAFRTWQLHVLERQEQRRQQILWNAAAAFREKQLLLAGLQAFRETVQERHDQRRLLALRAEMFTEWRRIAANSPRHWDLVLAINHRRRHLLRTALAAWREAYNGTVHQLARFWLRWQVQMPLHRALVVWKAVARWQRQQEQDKALALGYRRLMLLQKVIRAWRQAAPLLHEKRVLQGMAETQYSKTLAWRALDTWRSAAVQARWQRQQQPSVPQGFRITDENAPAAALALPAPPYPTYPLGAGPSSSGRSAVPPARCLGIPMHVAYRPRLGSPLPPSPRRVQQAAGARELQHAAVQYTVGSMELARPHPQHQQTVVIVHRTTRGSPAKGPSPQRRRQQQGRVQEITVHTGSSLEEAAAAHPEVHAMLQSVAAWKGSAEHWRQRLGSGTGSPASQGTVAIAGHAAGSGRGMAVQQHQPVASLSRASQHSQQSSRSFPRASS